MKYFDLAVTLADKYVNDYRSRHKDSIDYWEASPFYRLTKLPPGSKGKFGENYVKRLLADQGYSILKAIDLKSDFRIVNGDQTSSVEVKTSFLWSGNTRGNYKFQQVRLIESYDLLLCLGLSRYDIKLYPFTKQDLEVGGSRYSVDFMNSHGILRAQHSKSNCWFSVSDSNSTNWHSTGDVAEAIRFIESYLSLSS